MSSEKYKLHPVAALINFLKALKDLFFPIIFLFIANGFNFNFNFNLGVNSFFSEMVPLIILFLIVVYTFFAGIIKWWTFKYWFEESELRVEYGLIVKKKRYIPFDRIQSLNYKEGIFHRLFRLVQVTVETAGSKNGKPEAELTAITREEADRIEWEMNKAKQNYNISEEDEVEQFLPTNTIHKMSPKDLIILATTSNSVGVVIAGVAAVFSQVAQFISFEWIYEEFGHFVRFSAIFIALLVCMTFLFAWIISVAIILINYFDFTVTEEQGRIIITRGLLEKKRITIPLNRVQAVKIIESPFRQLFGLSSIVVENAGGGFSKGNEKEIVLFPLISKKHAIVPLKRLFPHFDFNLDDKDMVRSPRKARAFFYRVDFLWLIPLVGIISYFVYPYGLLSLLIIVPVIILGIWQHKTARYRLAGNQLTVIYRHINRVTFFVEKKRIQIAQQSQTYFQRKKQLATARIVVMSGISGAEAKAYNMEEHKIEELLKWYEH